MLPRHNNDDPDSTNQAQPKKNSNPSGLTWSAVESAGSSETILLLHGFSQGGWFWEPYLAQMSELLKANVVAVDLPGHGRSPHLLVDAPTFSELLNEQFGPIHVVGYSMGARLAMIHAAIHPESVKSLVSISGHPGIRDEQERKARVQSDAKISERLRRCEVVGNPQDTKLRFTEFLRWWISQPIFGQIGEGESQLDLRLTNTPISLARVLELFGTGVQVPVWDQIAQLSSPLLYMVGEMDVKYVAIGSELTTLRLKNSNYPTLLEVVPSTFHSVVSQSPDHAVRTIVHFIDQAIATSSSSN